MTRLYLYTIFHANLQFSCIPEDQYPLIIDQCFWPIVDLLDELPALKLGFEFPSDTLEILEREDVTFIEALRELWQRGRCEIVGSGYVRQIFPLIPAEVNACNLSLGNQGYQRIFSRQPLTSYLHEQTCATGPLQLYQQQWPGVEVSRSGFWCPTGSRMTVILWGRPGLSIAV